MYSNESFQRIKTTKPNKTEGERTKGKKLNKQQRGGKREQWQETQA